MPSQTLRAQGAGNTLLYFWALPNVAFQSTTIPGMPTYSSPALFVEPGGKADLVAVGANRTLLRAWATPGSAWSVAQVAGSGTTN